MKTTVAPSNLYITVLIGVGAYNNPSKFQKDSIYKSWDMPLVFLLYTFSGSELISAILLKFGGVTCTGPSAQAGQAMA